MLSNIEIADNGDLVLGYRDRFGDMTGTYTYAYNSTTEPLVTGIAAGDVLRACRSGTTYTLESNGSCGSLTGNLPGNLEGPGNGEFYNDSTVLNDAVHDQVGQGATALQPNRDKLWGTVYDPINAYEQGVRRWTADSGAIEGNLLVQATYDTSTPLPQNLFGKANGLADLELVCDQAPVQIGNRVWYDSNGNGVQDPSEPPVAGVVVTLTPPTGPPLTTTTDANGEYYLGTQDGLKPNTAYAGHLRLQRHRPVDAARLPDQGGAEVDPAGCRFRPCARLERRLGGRDHGHRRRPRQRQPHDRRGSGRSAQQAGRLRLVRHQRQRRPGPGRARCEGRSGRADRPRHR